MIQCTIHSFIYYVQTILELYRKLIIPSQKQCQYLVKAKVLQARNRKNRLQVMFTRLFNIVTHTVGFNEPYDFVYNPLQKKNKKFTGK